MTTDKKQHKKTKRPSLKKLAESQKAANFLKKTSPQLNSLIQKIGAPKLFFDSKKEVFEALASSIIYQQLHGKAAATIQARFVKLFSPTGKFPTAQQVIQSDLNSLRTCGLSQAKATAILDLASKVIAGSIPNRKASETMTDDELITALTQVKGIGRWTVEMFLIFTLGRKDVFPVHDFAVRKGFHIVFKKRKILNPKELDKISTQWKPYRSLFTWYMWRAVDLEKEEHGRNL